MFFELLGMDVYDLTQAIAASKHGQDEPLEAWDPYSHDWKAKSSISFIVDFSH